MSIGGSDPQRYLKVLLRWKLLFLAVLIGIPAIALVVVSRERNVYQSSALLQEDPLPVDTSLFTSESAGSPSATPSAETLSGEARVIETPTVAELAAARLKPAPASSRSLLKDVTATANAETGFITISATAHTPQRAAEVANAFAAAVVQLRTQQAIRVLNAAIDQLTSQLARMPPTDTVGQGQLSDQLQRLRALRAAQGTNAQVLQAAVANSNPISPRLGRTAGLGLLAGLLLGLGAVYIAEAADRRVRRPEDLEELTGLPLLAVVPRIAFSPGTSSARVDEAFHMLRSTLTFFNDDQPLSTIMIASPYSGDGKTTVATRLAVATAHAGRNVILVDADLRRPQVASRLGIDLIPSQRAHGLAAVLTKRVSLEAALVDVPLDQSSAHDPSIQQMQGRLRCLLGAETPPNPSELLASPRMRELLDQAGEMADLVIVDSNPLLSVSDSVPLLEWVSGSVLVAKLDRTTRDAVIRLQKTIVNTGGAMLGVVATGATGDSDGRYGYGAGYEDFASSNGGRRAALVRLRRPFERKPSMRGEPGRVQTVQATRRPGDIAVRPLSHAETVRLKRLAERARNASTRERAAILLGSNAGLAASAIAASRLTDDNQVRRVIREFNERGFDSTP
jgi:capsular exopolysaccharide synthesis family protein